MLSDLRKGMAWKAHTAWAERFCREAPTIFRGTKHCQVGTPFTSWPNSKVGKSKASSGWPGQSTTASYRVSPKRSFRTAFALLSQCVERCLLEHFDAILLPDTSLPTFSTTQPKPYAIRSCDAHRGLILLSRPAGACRQGLAMPSFLCHLLNRK